MPTAGKCRLEKVKCDACKGSKREYTEHRALSRHPLSLATLVERDPEYPDYERHYTGKECSACSGTGFRDYRIPEALVERVIVLLDNVMAMHDLGLIRKCSVVEYEIDREAKALLKDLTE